MECLVKSSYTPRRPDGLTIRARDKICNVEILGDGWFKGTIKERSGLMPRTYLALRSSSLTSELLSTLEFIVFRKYSALSPAELTIKEGDVISYMETAKDGWNKGTLIKPRQLFPDNYVKLNVGETPENAFQDMEFQVLFDFTAVKAEQLTLRKGDIITNVQYVIKSWNKGKVRDQQGLIPYKFVKLKPSKISDESLAILEFFVTEDYKSSKPSELTLQKGDILRNLAKVPNDPNFYRAELHGNVGLVLKKYVEIKNPTARDLARIKFIATSNYTPNVAKERGYLSIRKGDTITEVRLLTLGLYEGKIIGQTGMFPDNFVRISNATSEILKNKEFIVTSDYKSPDPDVAKLKQGEIIRGNEYVSDGWYRGTIIGKTGIFPGSNINLRFTTVPIRNLATFEFDVKYEYTSRTPEKLSLLVGDKVKAVQCASKGWLHGTVCEKTGVFPSYCVEVIRIYNQASINSKENLVNDGGRMSIREEDIPEELLCPVCLELPEKEIYQCKSGHTICATCVVSIQRCPQCRIRLRVDVIFEPTY